MFAKTFLLSRLETCSVPKLQVGLLVENRLKQHQIGDHWV